MKKVRDLVKRQRPDIPAYSISGNYIPVSQVEETVHKHLNTYVQQ